MAITPHATIDDLYRTPGRAELVNGEIRAIAPAGDLPARAALAIAASLRAHEQPGAGRAFTGKVAFQVNLPHRQSFSPDAAWYTGRPTGMKFLDGAPAFAAEIRSEGDYDAAAEEAIRRQRADYFAAGTLVVWDVDLLSDDVVRVYRASAPDAPALYRRGETAEAEPAVPGWRMPVDELFE